MKNKILAYLKETLTEMRKVTWPDQRYVAVAATIVLVLVIITAVFLMFADYALAGIFKVLLK